MSRRISVALLIETSNAHSRGVLEGVIDFMRQHEPWSITLPEQERGGRPPDWLSRWRARFILLRWEADARVL
jgi:LacI family transcriptional regulator